MKTNLKLVLIILFCNLKINAQTKQEVFSSIQKLVEKASGEKIQAGNVFAKKGVYDKLGKQVFTEKEVTVNTIPEGKSKYEWISRTTEMMWNEYLDFLIYTEFKNSNLQIVELNFKKSLKKEYFTSDKMGDDSPTTFYSKLQFYVLTSDKKELEQLLNRLYELKEKKLASPFDKEIEKFNKQQTITWLKEKLSNTIAGDQYTTSLKLISFDECNLVYEYTNFVGRKYQETMPTSIESISKYNRLTYSKKSCISKSFAYGGMIQEKYQISYNNFSFLSIKSKDEDLISNIECALKHLANFCNGTLTNQSSTINTTENKVAATQEIAKEQKTYYVSGKLKSLGKFIDHKANGEWKEYYENGQLKSIGKYAQGKQNGEWNYYYENGQLKQIGNLIGGKVTGECKNYHENGQLSQIGNFIDGISTGEWKFYNENAELVAKKLYDFNGKEIGNKNEINQEQKEYYDNGKVKSIGKLANNKGSGEWKFYFENGQIAAVGNFTNGDKNGEWKLYRENGQLGSIVNYTNGKITGEGKAYDKNGQLKQIAYYSDDKLNGEVKMYENGKLQQVRNYKNDIQNGASKYYSKSGQVSSIGNYIDGKQSGEFKDYYENGQLSSIGNYANDDKNGEWKFYNQNGKLNYIGKFTNSKQIGEWKRFNENGELIETKMYDANGKEIEPKKETTEKIKYSSDINEYDFVDDFPQYFWDLDYMNALSLISKKQYKNAIIKLDAILKKYPPTAGSNSICDANFHRGQANYFLGNYKEAIEDFNVLIEFNKSNSKSLEGIFYRGLAKINLKQMDAGCLDLYKAKEKFPDAEKEIAKYCK